MNRREFIACASFAGAASAVATAGAEGRKSPEGGAQLRLCLQWGAIPVADDFNAKLDYLEANGYSAVEIPTGKTGEWLLEKGEAFGKAMVGRKLTCATVCGPSRFDYADPAKNEYWLYTVNGEMASYGVDQQPVEDKDVYAFSVSVFE